MIYRTRDGRELSGNDGQDRFLERLYGCRVGRLLVACMIRPWVSKAGGAFLSSPLSKGMIRPFIRKNRINMSRYEDRRFRSYDDFFTRKLKTPAFDAKAGHLISPCDSKLTALPIGDDSVFSIKHSRYTTASLLRNAELAARFRGGWALIFRLTVDDYHRYCYIDGGRKGENVRIPGVLHTVNPAAYSWADVYKENAREYSLLESEHFGTVLMMEVGALMVGKIVNHHGAADVQRGQEKGYFRFGGSTVILLLEPGRVSMDEDILKNSADGVETVVKCGERIGCAIE